MPQNKIEEKQNIFIKQEKLAVKTVVRGAEFEKLKINIDIMSTSLRGRGLFLARRDYMKGRLII